MATLGGLINAHASRHAEYREWNCTPPGWSVVSIEPSRFEVRPGLNGTSFNEGGAGEFIVVVKRAG